MLNIDIKLNTKSVDNILLLLLIVSGVIVAVHNLFSNIDGEGSIIALIIFVTIMLCIGIKKLNINDDYKRVIWVIFPFTVACIKGLTYSVAPITLFFGIGTIIMTSIYIRSRLTLFTGIYVLIFETILIIVKWGELNEIFKDKYVIDGIISIYVLYICTIIILVIANLVGEKYIEQNNNQLSKNKELLKGLSDKNIELNNINEKLQLAQKHIIQSEKMASLGSLVAAVSHEVNTPLGVSVTAISYLKNSFNQFIESMNKGELTKSEFDILSSDIIESINLTDKNLERASNLMENFKKTSVDHNISEKRRFYLKKYIGDIMYTLKPILKKTSLLLDVKYEGEEYDIEINSFAGELNQVITNLITNSIQHGYPGEIKKGNITIDIIPTPKTVILIYNDDGIGMTNEVKKRIFEPFFTTTRGKGGSGLGMYITYNLITSKFNGTIECDSFYGNGTTFRIEIPREI